MQMFQIKEKQRFTASIRCVVERITYQNPENGYSVLKVAVKGYDDLVTVVGNLLDVNVGSVLQVHGNWKVDAKYGRQFAAESWEETMPATAYGIEKYLGSGLIKGVGPKFAKRIVQQFGADTLEVIETDIDRLMTVPGIGKKRVLKIAESWEKQKEVKNIMLFLQDHGVSTSFAAKIYRQYGNESIQKVRDNPFRLADDIWGIGFKTADQIAEKLGFSKDSAPRLRSGIMYTLSELSNEGHVFAGREQLIKKSSELLEADANAVTQALDVMISDGDLIMERRSVDNESAEASKTTETAETLKTAAASKTNEILQTTGIPEAHEAPKIPKASETAETSEALEIPKSPKGDAADALSDAIYLPPFYYAECGVSSGLKRLAGSPASDRLWVRLSEAIEKTGNKELSVDVSGVEAAVGMHYDEVQQEAIRKAAVSKVLILTGGPGTGKTTTTLGIISAFKAYGLSILLAAPTGRAAKRMTEATGMEAKTIHRLLEYKPPEGYQMNEEHRLEGDVLIVDECSMIDIVLMNALLKALPDSMRLILVGDIDQLPSVGAGNVLRDMIDSEKFPVIRLTRIFRQAEKSRIITNAHRINKGIMPDLSNGSDTDFFFINREEPETAVPEIVELVQKKLPRFYKVPPESVQVLTPMQRGTAGAANLNQLLQAALNPEGEGLRRSGIIFRIHDKVMQIKNNYDKEVFNGDIGVIESVDMEDRTLSIRFDDRLVDYDGTELDELVHAYAATIHKAQGSEYPIVVMPVLMSHFIMLQRNLIYTGITRAKKALVIVGTKKALSYAVRNVTVTRRNTLLKERLREDSGYAGYVGSTGHTGKTAPRAVSCNGAGHAANEHSGNRSNTAAGDTAVECAAAGNIAAKDRLGAYSRLFKRLSASAFRSRFRLSESDCDYVKEKGEEELRRHAENIIAKRLCPAEPANDGRQTPMRGHPVFIAQHAAACCCRDCLSKWHGIPKGRPLTDEEKEYVINVLMEWIKRQAGLEE